MSDALQDLSQQRPPKRAVQEMLEEASQQIGRSRRARTLAVVTQLVQVAGPAPLPAVPSWLACANVLKSVLDTVGISLYAPALRAFRGTFYKKTNKRRGRPRTRVPRAPKSSKPRGRPRTRVPPAPKKPIPRCTDRGKKCRFVTTMTTAKGKPLEVVKVSIRCEKCGYAPAKKKKQ